MWSKFVVSKMANFRGFMVVLLCVTLIALPCVLLPNTALPNKLIFQSSAIWNRNYDFMLEYNGSQLSKEEHLQLVAILKKSAMADKTVVLTTLNQAWATPDSMIDLFLESFRLGEGIRSFLDHLIIVALDQKAYDRCRSIHSYCFFLKTEGVDFSGEKGFMTDDYLKMMWRRIDFLRTILEMGYSFLFTDADIMWFRNPFLHFDKDADFQIACDHFTGSSSDLRNEANGGFNYVRSNNRTINFYRYWYLSRELHPGKHDQDVLNLIKHDGIIRELKLKLWFLDTSYFGGFCEASKDFNKVCTMHANCCYGLRNKLEDLKLALTDWSHFKSLSLQQNALEPSSWIVPKYCRKKKKILESLVASILLLYVKPYWY